MKREVNMVTHMNYGLFINIEQPWLSATPDGIVVYPSEPTTHRNGLLEIK